MNIHNFKQMSETNCTISFWIALLFVYFYSSLSISVCKGKIPSRYISD